jgi:uncharacterized protein
MALMNTKGLSTNLTPRFNYYVYVYRDPRDNKIFYIGKGCEERIGKHLTDYRESKKTQKIKEIRDAGKEPIIEYLRDGLDEKTAYSFEALAIDVIGIDYLTNVNHPPGLKKYKKLDKTKSHNMDSELLTAIIDPNETKIIEPAILIRINQSFWNGMSDKELYDVTRGIWPMSTRRNGARYAFAVFKGIVMEVYEINEWHRAGTTSYATRPDVTYENIDPDRRRRWEFTGEPADKKIRDKYRLKSVKKYFVKNSQYPITYVNC